ncbi:MAG: trypsin-like peptidase domain-containing protein [Rhizobiaceae bacterium]|nr:trypsin-like peptidase domain-containing protein [Rhizobiaceae bacterium]
MSTITSRRQRLGDRILRSLVATLIVGAATICPAAALAEGPSAALVNVDPTQPPFDAVGRVNNSVGGRCTGVLVRADIAVTAAHCLYNTRTARFVRPQSVHFLLGFDRGSYRFHTVAASVTIASGYDPKGAAPSLVDDWAILHLAAPAPSTIAPMAIADDRPGPRRVIAAGFARRRPEVLTATPPCTTASERQRGLIVSDCLVSQGLSGGPMIDAETFALVGLQVAIASRGAKPIALSVPVPPLAAEGEKAMEEE